MHYKNLILAVVVMGLLVACDKKPTQEQSQVNVESNKPVSMLLQYVIEEPDLEPYPSRVIVTNDYMRIDEGEGSESFVLFDRKKKVVYSVASDNDAILVVKKRALPEKSPIELNDSVRIGEDNNVPEISGKKAVHYYLDTNGVNCYQAFIVKDLLPAAIEAYKEYRLILAGDHAFTMDRIPADVLEPCDLSMNIFSSTRLYDKGLPIHERGPHGYVKTLINYETNFKTSDAIFTLPEGYGRFTIDDMRKDFITSQEKAAEQDVLKGVVPEEILKQ